MCAQAGFLGVGYATEACTRLLEFAFSETMLNAVFATTDDENHASQNVLTKSGMRAVGPVRAFAGEYPGYKVMREDWVSEKGLNSPKV
ncbi:GNAT family N-acetyltransferase [Sulfitobacter aestuariivivens]|uniref:GNAT family N-acetyltransferase n=1 Tax=Sulfitobacter aestuariivivens TaxID=2766981 RepID=UPI003620F4F0